LPEKIKAGYHTLLRKLLCYLIDFLFFRSHSFNYVRPMHSWNVLYRLGYLLNFIIFLT